MTKAVTTQAQIQGFALVHHKQHYSTYNCWSTVKVLLLQYQTQRISMTQGSGI